MIDYNALKELFGSSLPESHIFFATHGVRSMGISYARLRRELGLSSAHTNRKIWKLFEAKYNKETTDIPVETFTANPNSATVLPGATYQINTVITPSNATDKTITYMSANTEIATVSASGLVTVLAGATPGATVVITPTTTSGNKTAPVTITVGSPA